MIATKRVRGWVGGKGTSLSKGHSGHYGGKDGFTNNDGGNREPKRGAEEQEINERAG